MKKILLCLFALLLLCGCAKDSTPVQIPEQAQLGSIHSVSPSYETRYFSNSMDLWKDETSIAAFRTAYEQVFPQLTQTSKAVPAGNQYFFRIYHKKGDEASANLYLRLVDDGEKFWLELKPKNYKPEWTLTYTLAREAAQPLMTFFEDEPIGPNGKPLIEGHPDGRVVPLSERVEKGWPIFEGTVTAVSDKVQEFSLHEELQYGWLYREFTVEVVTCHNGELKEGDKLTYRVFGGETDNYCFSVPGAPQVAVGDYVVIAAEEHSFCTAYNLFPTVEHSFGNYPVYTFSPPVGVMPPADRLLQTTYHTYDLGRYCNNLRYASYLANENSTPLPERVTDRELQELQRRYAYYPDFFPAVNVGAIPGWELLQDIGYDGLVVLDFTGEFRVEGGGTNHKLFEGPELDALTTPSGANILFARVEEVLLGCEDLKEGDLVPVMLGAVMTPMESVRTFFPGQRFVCFVQQTDDAGEVYYLPGGLAAALQLVYHLTEDNVVFYCGSPRHTFPSELSGMYLDSFVEVIRENLFSD